MGGEGMVRGGLITAAEGSESDERRWGKIVFVNLLYNYSLRNGRSGQDGSRKFDEY